VRHHLKRPASTRRASRRLDKTTNSVNVELHRFVKFELKAPDEPTIKAVRTIILRIAFFKWVLYPLLTVFSLLAARLFF
jgi:hypothetical protein